MNLLVRMGMGNSQGAAIDSGQELGGGFQLSSETWLMRDLAPEA